MGIADSSSGNCHYQFLYVIAGTAIAHFSRLNSVCLSVWPSVCLSHRWISHKWCKL